MQGYSWRMYLLEKSNYIVTVLTAAFVMYTRSAGVAYFAVGAVMCSRIVKLLKMLFRQPRPAHTASQQLRRKRTYGMPSTHSAVIAYYAAYVAFACARLPIHPSLPQSAAFRMLVPPAFFAATCTIVASRVWLGHHTWPQVTVGVSCGLAFAPVWFILWTRGWNEYGRTLEQAYSVRY